MNYLLFKTSEVELKTGIIEVTGQRACYIRDRHELTQIGASIKAGILGGHLGQATLKNVLNLDTENPTYIFEGRFDQDPPARNDITLVIGVPRPQTVKKIVQIAVSFGIKEVHFLRMEKTIPSYCDSKVWEESSIEAELLEALEQVGDSIAPNFIMNSMPNFFARAAFNEFFHSYSSITAYDGAWQNKEEDIGNSVDQNSLLILGPEAGFSVREREWLFAQPKIIKAGLGNRMLRLEHAAAAALSRKTIKNY